MCRRLIIEVLAVFFFFVAFIAWPSQVPAAATARPAAPAFNFDDSTGKPIRLSDLKGKVVLLDFWATWCHGCKTEIPWFIEFQNEYKSDGLSAVGVSMDDDGWKSVRPFLVEHKINYPIVIGTKELGKLYSVETMPVTVLIDRNGEIAATHAGMVDKDSFEKEIQALLQEQGASGNQTPR